MSTTDYTPSERSPLLGPSSNSSTLTDANDYLNDPPPEKATLSRARSICIAASLYVLVFILTANISLLSTIQSPIATELEAYASVSWFASAYLIAVSSVTPLAGRLSLIFSPKYYLFASINLLCIGLLLTAFAPRLWVFLLGRALTGMGGGAVTPTAFILVTELTSKKRRGLFFGLINTGYTSGVALGAIIAGALEPLVGWRAVFWLQIPVALTAATVALFSIPTPQPSNQKTSTTTALTLRQKLLRIDYLGTITLITSVVLFLYSLSAPKIHPTPILFSLIILALFIYIEGHYAHEPIVPLPILKSRANLLTGLSTILLMAARWGILFYSPVYAIAVRTWSPASAGLMLLPTNGGFACGGILAGWLHIRRTGSFYAATITSYILFATSLFFIAHISTASSNVYLYISSLFFNGFFTGALLNYSLAHLLHLTPPPTHPIVIPLNAMFRGLSASLGAAVAGGIFLRTLNATLESEFEKRGMLDSEGPLITRLLGSPALVRTLRGTEREVAVLGYQASLRTLFMVGSGFALLAALAQAGTGWTEPDALDGDEDVLSNHDVISPVHSRDVVAN